jgi:hypothetical protein
MYVSLCLVTVCIGVGKIWTAYGDNLKRIIGALHKYLLTKCLLTIVLLEKMDNSEIDQIEILTEDVSVGSLERWWAIGHLGLTPPGVRPRCKCAFQTSLLEAGWRPRASCAPCSGPPPSTRSRPTRPASCRSSGPTTPTPCAPGRRRS